MILLLDNYDSFTYNLAHALGPHVPVHVVRNDEIDLEGIRRLRPEGIVIGPGPGHPANRGDFGVCGDVLRELSPSIPTLGVCLGLQGIVTAYGGRVVHARKAIHGKTSPLRHDGRGLLSGLPNPMTIVRYHSLVAEERSLPRDLVVTCRDRGEVMGVRHRKHPVEGVQFHPESIGSPDGQAIFANFARACRRRRR